MRGCCGCTILLSMKIEISCHCINYHSRLKLYFLSWMNEIKLSKILSNLGRYLQDKRERLRHALVSIAWPMSQAGISTVLSLCVLAIIQAYMVKVFVKVVILVVGLGLFHGLIVLPVVFGALPLSKNAPQASAATQKVCLNGCFVYCLCLWHWWCWTLSSFVSIQMT